MIPIRRHFARFAALIFAVAAVASCDTRAVTGPGDDTPQPGGGDPSDVEKPTISFSLSVGTNNTVDVGAALKVTVTATDNIGVQTMYTSVNNGPSIIGSDTTVLKPVQATAARIVPVSMSGLKNGDKLVVRSTVGDASLNFASDSLIISISDTTVPRVILASGKAAPGLKGSDTLDVRVTANDSAGISYVGYRIKRLSATDSIQVFAESTFVAAGVTTTIFGPPTYKWILPDSLLTGNYMIEGFAQDRSGILSRPNPTKTFTVVDGKKPTLTFIVPAPAARLNVGDSLLVTARLQDNIGISRVTFVGKSARGSAALGTADTVIRYPAVVAPQAGVFAPGLRDTTISRYLKVLTPIDTTADSLIVIGILADAATPVQLADTQRVIIRMATGPKVRFLAPLPGDSATAAAGLTVTVRATHPIGVAKLGFRMQGASNWLTPLDTTIAPIVSPAQRDYTFTATVLIPANAPPKSIITITPVSLDVDGQEGSSNPMFIPVRVGAPPGPVVTQDIPARVERTDSITITAAGYGLTYVGYELRDRTGAVVKRDSVSQGAPPPSTAIARLALNLPATTQGKKMAVISFAYDVGGRIGYSVRQGVTASQPNPAAAWVDSTLIVFGRTFALPADRAGLTIGDVTVDQLRGNVFLSNTQAGRLEVWQKATNSFDPNGVVIGSQPWGMTMSRTALAQDTMYVANSGGTNLSRVYIGAATPSGMKEDLPNRILTRISLLYKVTEQRDPTTQKIRITMTGPIIYSDRPQYIQQSMSGRIYLSTKPTAASGQEGTVRYLEPSAPAPDQRFILAFATAGSDPNSYLVANVDNVDVIPAPASSTANDTLVICDHPSGSTAAASCVKNGGGIGATIAALRALVPTTDVDAAVNLNENSLGLTDTTYAAASGDGQWIAFGEGNRSPFGRAFLLRDDNTVPGTYTYASPALNIADLINNASDQVFGVALDKTGKTLGVHGGESYFAAVAQPFTQRLQGKKTTFGSGSGIAFHPNADGTTSPQADRLAFVASNNGTIELVDIAYYDFNRGTLATKSNLYGPLRASLPFPGDDPSVILKLFGVSPSGLVVIDVTAADIKPGP
jgi:hypothetical protein